MTAVQTRMDRRSIAWRAALAGLAVGGLELWTAVASPHPGEPLVERWARTVAVHPLRSTLACALLLAGLGGRPAARPVTPSTEPVLPKRPAAVVRSDLSG